MFYADARERIKSGDLLAWTHTGWGSWTAIKMQIVRIFTRSEYSHVGIAWTVAGRVFVLEASTGGVRIYPLSEKPSFWWVSLPELRIGAEEYALSKVGERYSYWQAITGFLKTLKPGADRSWQCAEYALAVLRENGLNMGEATTPAKLMKALLTDNYDMKWVEV